MERAERSGPPSAADAAAGERYLLLADISGYTGFMAGVELEHGIDFGDGIPAAYSVLGALLAAVIEGLEPDFAVVKLEGDAVFAIAPAASLDGQGDRVREKLTATYRAFTDARTEAIPASDHIARPARLSRTSTSRRCSIGVTQCARRSGPAATCWAQP